MVVGNAVRTSGVEIKSGLIGLIKSIDLIDIDLIDYINGFFRVEKTIDLIDVSINQSSLQISTNLVPQQLSKPNLELYQFVKIHATTHTGQHLLVTLFCVYSAFLHPQNCS